MFNFNWASLRLLIPSFLRKTIFFEWLDVMHSQIVVIHGRLLDYRDDALYKMNHNSQVIYFEKVINDKFDSINRAIWIETTSNTSRFFLFRKGEGKPKRYLYRKWDAAVAYVEDDYAVDGLNVYVALASTTGEQPSLTPAKWELYKAKNYIYRQSDYTALIDFIVWVPDTLVYNENQLKVMINYYKFADKQYTIQTYTP